MGPLGLTGHLGDRCAALVDGQLPPDQVERAWAHVHACPGCREAVAQQVAVKQALGGLRPADRPAHAATREVTGIPGATGTSRGVGTHGELDDLVPADGSWLGPDALAAWERVAQVEHAARRRALAAGLGTGIVGGGALTATLAVAVAMGATGVLGTAQVRPVPDEVAPGALAATADHPRGSGERGRAAGEADPDAVAALWTGSATGAETARVTALLRP